MTERHVFVPGASPLDCAICGQPRFSSLRGPDAYHKAERVKAGGAASPRTEAEGREARQEALRRAIRAIRPDIVNGARVTAAQVLGVLEANGWTLARRAAQEAPAPEGLRGHLLNALGRYAGLRDNAPATALQEWQQIERLMARLADYRAEARPPEGLDATLESLRTAHPRQPAGHRPIYSDGWNDALDALAARLAGEVR